MTAKKRVARKKIAKKVPKKNGNGKRIVAKRSSKKTPTSATPPNQEYLNAIAYLVSSEEKEINLMVASTIGLIED